MTRPRATLIFIVFCMFCMSACRDKPTCLNCGEDVAAEDNDGTPPPDLPCGGADLMTDNLNCGTCGHECEIWYRDTEYEAGSCNDGVCGPGGWSSCIPGENTVPWKNCSDICISLGDSCVPNGCAGLTGMMFATSFDGWGCSAYRYTPVVTMSGGCDELIPWGSPGESLLDVQCCCDLQ